MRYSSLFLLKNHDVMLFPAYGFIASALPDEILENLLEIPVVKLPNIGVSKLNQRGVGC